MTRCPDCDSTDVTYQVCNRCGPFSGDEIALACEVPDCPEDAVRPRPAGLAFCPDHWLELRSEVRA